MSKLEQVLVAIGKGSSRVEIISSAILALVTFFYAYTISSFLRIQVFVLRDRIVYDNPFDQYILGYYADHLVISIGLLAWLYLSLRVSKKGYLVCLIFAGTLIAAVVLGPPFVEIFSVIIFPIIATLVVNNRGKKGMLVTVNGTLYLEYFALIFIFVSAVSIIVSLQSLLSVNLSAYNIRNYAYEIFVMLSPASVASLALIVFAYPLKLIIRELSTPFPFLKNLSPRSDNSPETPSKFVNDKMNTVQFGRKRSVSRRRNEVLYLLPLLALSACLAVIPYQPAMNEDNRLVGVDTPLYAAWINDMVKSAEDGLGEFLKHLFSEQSANGDRPLTLFLMFLAVKIINTDDIAHMLDRSPTLLAPLLVLSVYFLTRQMTSSYTTSYLAAFLTVVSFQVLIGIFAGFYANWIALITGYFSLGFLFRFLHHPQTSTLMIFAALLIATLFAHVYTWTIISFCAAIFLILLLLLRRRDYSRKAILLALVIVGVSAAVDISKSLATNSSSGIFQDVELSGTLMGPEEFTRRWDILIFTVYSGLGGIMANSVVMLLGLYWVFKSDYKKPSTLFLLVFLSMAILPLFFGDWVIQSRTIYLIPFQIPASLGLSYLLVKKKPEKANLYTSKQNWSILSTTSVVAICAVLFAVAVSVLSNLYLVLPS
jgi:hypothetical protein